MSFGLFDLSRFGVQPTTQWKLLRSPVAADDPWDAVESFIDFEPSYTALRNILVLSVVQLTGTPSSIDLRLINQLSETPPLDLWRSLKRPNEIITVDPVVNPIVVFNNLHGSRYKVIVDDQVAATTYQIYAAWTPGANFQLDS